jgi:tetratricopeptide (TPR) repeat protein
MRAHGIPTRLVAGLYLAQGGYWVYHMWTAYWDGATWRQIDPVNIDAAPGALYVAIGRGATRFTDVRPDVAAFQDRAFSGVSFDLVSASSDGEPLKLAYPRTPGGTERDAAAFNAAVLAVRGDPAGALAALDAAVSGDTATVTARLFRAELLVQLGRYGEALEAIAALRRITSLPANTAALDVLALRCHVGLEDRTAAEAALARAAEELGPGSPPHTALAARLLFALGAEGEAIDLLGEAIEDAPDEVELLACFAELVARAERGSSPELLRAADERGRAALELSRYADAHLYAAAARVALRLGERSRALAYADAGLVLAPFDRELVSLAAEIDGCPPAPR